MTAVIFILLVGVPIAEIALFIKAGEAIGLGPTVAVVILTAAIGTALLRHQGLATLRQAEASLNDGRFPVDQVFDGLCLLVAGALLLTPGFLTDGLGLALFVPPVRRVIARALVAVLARRGKIVVETQTTGASTVIDGDYEVLTPAPHPPDRDTRQELPGRPPAGDGKDPNRP